MDENFGKLSNRIVPSTQHTNDVPIERLLEQSLRFECVDACVSEVKGPFSTGWRTLPLTVVNQWINTEVNLDVASHGSMRIPAGDCFMIPASVSHRITVNNAHNVVCRWAHVRYWVLESVDFLSVSDTAQIIPQERGTLLAELTGQLAVLHSANEIPSLLSFVRKQGIGFQLLGELMAHTNSGQVIEELFTSFLPVLPVLQYIESHLSAEISREELARSIQLSPTRLHVVFKESLGVTPMEYVKRLRLQHAQRLLVESDLTVAQIGERVGFRDPFHFSRVFKTACGMNPSQYRQATRSSLQQWTNR